MTAVTSFVITGCWIAVVLVWIGMAFATKRTSERGGLVGYRVAAAIPILALILAGRLLGIAGQTHLWRRSLAVDIVSDCIVLAGTAFTIWARTTLGRNWSAEVTFKQDHELIESGPYALARHPIYTGLLTMTLGTAIDYARAIGFAVLIGVFTGIWWKARQEERIMSRHFPGTYAAYKARVRAIIPFVL